MKKSIKYVDYCKPTKLPVITWVRGYNRLINPPKAVIKKDSIKPLVLGY